MRRTISPTFTVARFEIKTLLRSWFFRIFSAIAIIIITFFNFILFPEGSRNLLSSRVIMGGIPYLNLYLLNIVQAIIAVFLSSDFLGRDKKLDTTEVVYVRNMSNFQYVVGKTLGIFTVFGLLNLVVLLISLVFNFISPDAGFSLKLYVLYPILISFPTLLFILGLSFFLMMIIKNQAVTFIVLLGYIAVDLFYLQYNTYGIWDYIGFFTPMAYSSFTGLENIATILSIRIGYVLLGLAFVLFTVFKLPRLNQGKRFPVSLIFGILFSLLGIASLFSVFQLNRMKEAGIASMKLLEEKLPDSQSYRINNYDIQLAFDKASISVKNSFDVRAVNNDRIKNKLKFFFNNGLSIDKVTINGKDTQFSRNLDLLTIENSSVNDSIHVVLEYNGVPNEKYAYFNIKSDDRQYSTRYDLLLAGSKSLFVSDNYLLLTKESFWYPVVAERNTFRMSNFFNAKISVTNNKDLTVICPGIRSNDGSGKVVFDTKVPISKIPVVIGEYTKKSITVDSVAYNVFMKPKNDLFSKYFQQIGDTLPGIIRDMKSDYERKLGLKYPYQSLNIVEVPLHFHSYFRSWSLTNENTQPGMVFLTERGLNVSGLNLANSQNMYKGFRERRGNEVNEKDMEVSLFEQFIGNVFTNSTGGFGPGRGIQIFTQNNLGRTLDSWSQFSIFPLYYNYVYAFQETGLPIYNMTLESYMISRVNTEDIMRPGQQLNSNDEAVLALKENKEKLTDLVDQDDLDFNLSDILIAIGDNKLALLQSQIGISEFGNFVDSVLNRNKFSYLQSNVFMDSTSTVEATENIQLASYIFNSAEAYSFTDDNQKRYFVGMKLANTSDIDGAIKVSIYGGAGGRNSSRGGFGGPGGGGPPDGGGGPGGGFGGGPGGGMTVSYENVYLVGKKKSAYVGMILDYAPRMMVVNSYLSENIPSDNKISLADFKDAPAGFKAFNGIKELKHGTVHFQEDDEIIVDNEDPGFSIEAGVKQNTLKEFLNKTSDEGVGKYKDFNMFRPSTKWELVLNSEGFGKYAKSFVYKEAGSGSTKVKFTANIPKSGTYEVYAMIPSERLVRGFGPPGRRNDSNKEKRTFTYTVISDDGIETVEVPTDSRVSDWQFVGEYYFSEGDASVELSDKTSNRIVVADAVKWIRK